MRKSWPGSRRSVVGSEGAADSLQLQAATNIALDLDVRPLPKLITLPRRRRRRRNPDGTPITTSAAAGASAGEPTGETIDAPQSRAFERMLVEEAALDTGPQATVM